MFLRKLAAQGIVSKNFSVRKTDLKNAAITYTAREKKDSTCLKSEVSNTN